MNVEVAILAAGPCMSQNELDELLYTMFQIHQNCSRFIGTVPDSLELFQIDDWNCYQQDNNKSYNKTYYYLFPIVKIANIAVMLTTRRAPRLSL